MTERPFVDFEDSIEFIEHEKEARRLMMQAIQSGFYDIVDRYLELYVPFASGSKKEIVGDDPLALNLMYFDEGSSHGCVKQFSLTDLLRVDIDIAREDPSNHDGLSLIAERFRALADEIDAAVKEGRAFWRGSE